jgi:hypothetical protein
MCYLPPPPNSFYNFITPNLMVSSHLFVSLKCDYLVFIVSLVNATFVMCPWLRRLPHAVIFIFHTFRYSYKGCHLDVVRGPSTPHDPKSDAGGSLSSWQGHPSR